MKRSERCLNFDMEYIMKMTAVAITAAVFALVIRKNNPEMALLLGVMMSVLCLVGLADVLTLLVQKVQQWQFNGLIAREYFVPLLKCLGIAFVAQFGSAVCKDAGQSAAATGLELCGSVTAAWCLLPLIEHLFGLFEDML